MIVQAGSLTVLPEPFPALRILHLLLWSQVTGQLSLRLVSSLTALQKLFVHVLNGEIEGQRDNVWYLR